jgi:hypothetical protein
MKSSPKTQYGQRIIFTIFPPQGLDRPKPVGVTVASAARARLTGDDFLNSSLRGPSLSTSILLNDRRAGIRFARRGVGSRLGRKSDKCDRILQRFWRLNRPSARHGLIWLVYPDQRQESRLPKTVEIEKVGVSTRLEANRGNFGSWRVSAMILASVGSNFQSKNTADEEKQRECGNKRVSHSSSF